MKFRVLYQQTLTTHVVRFVLSSKPPAELSAGSIVTWTANTSAAWRIPPYALMPTTCCTLFAGGECHHTGDI